MKETYFLDICPACEDAEGNQRKLALTWKDQLQRTRPAPEGSYYKITSNPHDFGDYLSVDYVYDPENDEHQKHWQELDENFPQRWDLIALGKLNPITKESLEKDLVSGPEMRYDRIP